VKGISQLTTDDFDRIDFVKTAIRASLNRNLQAWGMTIFSGVDAEYTDAAYQEYCKYETILKMDDITIYNKFVKPASTAV
jgi:hypothetical protein